MAVFGERGEVAELAQRDHTSSDKLIGTPMQIDWT
jgi:hypothetical protein